MYSMLVSPYWYCQRPSEVQSVVYCCYVHNKHTASCLPSFRKFFLTRPSILTFPDLVLLKYVYSLRSPDVSVARHEAKGGFPRGPDAGEGQKRCVHPGHWVADLADDRSLAALHTRETR